MLEANANPNLAQTEDFAVSALAGSVGYDALLERIMKTWGKLPGRLAAELTPGIGAAAQVRRVMH